MVKGVIEEHKNTVAITASEGFSFFNSENFTESFFIEFFFIESIFIERFFL